MVPEKEDLKQCQPIVIWNNALELQLSKSVTIYTR